MIYFSATYWNNRFSFGCFQLCFIKKTHHIIEIQKLKYKTGQYFIQNYLRSKYKHSKSITKGMSKSELWKEQTGWKLGNTPSNDNNNNNKNKQAKKEYICLPGQTLNIFRLSFFAARHSHWKFNFCFASPTHWKNRISFAGPAQWKKLFLIYQPIPLEKSSLICRPGTDLGPGPQPCRPLVHVLTVEFCYCWIIAQHIQTS